jgi:hypothetical protein
MEPKVRFSLMLISGEKNGDPPTIVLSLRMIDEVGKPGRMAVRSAFYLDLAVATV